MPGLPGLAGKARALNRASFAETYSFARRQPVPADPIETLKQARESFVRKRRMMAEQMIPAGAAAQHFAPAFADLQASIEAIDRAIADEEKLPEGYAVAEPEVLEEIGTTSDAPSASNVVDIDFDPLKS
jgi:hypothetical protein